MGCSYLLLLEGRNPGTCALRKRERESRDEVLFVDNQDITCCFRNDGLAFGEEVTKLTTPSLILRKTTLLN